MSKELSSVSDLAIDDYEALERRAELDQMRFDEMYNRVMNDDDAFEILFEYMIDYDQMLTLMKVLRNDDETDWSHKFTVSLVEKVVRDNLDKLEYEMKWRDRIY